MTKLRIVLVVFLGLSVIQALPAAKSKAAITGLIPKTNEKKSLIAEEEKLDEPAKPKMAIENAEELKKGDRTKKSAATTFCVEIRPGTQEQPNQICDPPSPPPPPPQPEPEYHDCHEYSPYGPISHVDLEVPVNVIPSAPAPTPFVEYYHPVYPPAVYYEQPSIHKLESQPQSDPQPPQAPLQIYVQPQQPYYPPPPPPAPIYHLDVVHPCPPPPCSSLVPHLHHLVAVHGKNAMPDSPIEMMRNNDLNDGQTQSASYPMMYPQPMDAADMENPNSPNSRNYAVPSPYSRGFSSPIPVSVPQQQQPLTSSCASGFAASGRRDSTEGAFNMQVQPQMPIGDQRTFLSGRHPIQATRPTQGYYPMMPMHPGGFDPQRRYPQMRYQRQQNEQKAKDAEIEEKSNDQGNSMTPSKMLNQMRGQESSQKSAPTMQTFPREHDDKDNEKPQIKIHIPSHGQPIVIGSSENEKTSESTKNEGSVIEKKD